MTWQLNNLFKCLLISFNAVTQSTYAHNPHAQPLYTHSLYSHNIVKCTLENELLASRNMYYQDT